MVKRKPKRKYDAETLKQALRSVINGNMTAYKASKLFQIPNRTLRDHINNKCVNPKPGVTPVLMASEEALLVKWIHHTIKIGFPVTKHQLLYSVEKLVKNINKPNTFRNGMPSRHWYDGFFIRHPNLRHKVCEVLKISRVNATEKHIANWFINLRKYFADINCLDVLEDPTRIFTCDESDFYINSNGAAVLARNKKARNLEKENEDNECLTLSLGASADGKRMPILALFHSYQMADVDKQKYPITWDIGQLHKGQITCETFYKYISHTFNNFLIEKNINKPVVLFLDNQVTHLSLPLSKFCEENGIIIMALLPTLTHSLQPMDHVLCHDIKTAWSACVHKWITAHDAQKLNIEEFSPMLDKCIQETLQPQCIINGFLLAGLYPFNENAVDYSKIINATPLKDCGNTTNASSDENTLCFYDDRSKHGEMPQSKIKNSLTFQKVTSPYGTYSIQFVRQFEKQLGTIKLRKFQNCVGNWQGDVKDTNLYNFWRQIGGQTNRKSSSVSYDLTIIEMFQTLIKDHL